MPVAVQREDFDTLAPEWKGLLERVAEPVPFLHPTWQRVWLDDFQADREALVLSVRDDGELIGVAPMLRDDGTLSLVGHYSICDYMDFVVGQERWQESMRAIVEALAGEGWNEIELRGIRATSSTLAALPDACRANGLTFAQEVEAVAPRVTLPGSWAEYMELLPKKDRHELRRKQRRLQSAGQLELRTYTSPPEIEAHLPQLLRFMAESRSDKASFLTEKMGRFFHRMADALSEESLLRLYELELDSKAVASVLCFDQGGQLYFYNSGYDPEYSSMAVGLISKAMCMEDAMACGKHCVDFLRGREPYKYDLGGEDLTIYRCTVRRT